MWSSIWLTIANIYGFKLKYISFSICKLCKKRSHKLSKIVFLAFINCFIFTYLKSKATLLIVFASVFFNWSNFYFFIKLLSFEKKLGIFTYIDIKFTSRTFFVIIICDWIMNMMIDWISFFWYFLIYFYSMITSLICNYQLDFVIIWHDKVYNWF